ncbi:unnamed protein product, partial [Choristocarpus tenellus]
YSQQYKVVYHHSQVEALHTSNNFCRYKISDRMGIQVYQAIEDTSFCWRCCCGALRPVHIKMFDITGHQASDHPLCGM